MLNKTTIRYIMIRAYFQMLNKTTVRHIIIRAQGVNNYINKIGLNIVLC